jgi:hypothetical protein
MTDKRNQMMAQRDMLQISEFIEAKKPMWELLKLELLTGPLGPPAANGEIASLINISI